MAEAPAGPTVTVTPMARDLEKETSIVTEATIDSGEEKPIFSTTPANSKAEKSPSVCILQLTANSPPSAPRPVLTEDLPTIPRIRYLVLVFGLASGLFLSMLDASIVATSLFSIAADLDNLEHINWVALAYGLTYLGFAALFARVSDVVGRRAAFTVAFGIFIAFSFGCGFSERIEQLIVCRAFQGVGGAGLYSISTIVLPEMTPDKHKKYIGAIVGMVIATSGVMGPVLGGFLTEYITWRWVFWINGPIGVVALISFLVAWPDEEYLPIYEQRTWKELDYLGSVLLMAFAVLIVFPFQNLPSQESEYDSSTLNPYAQPTFIYPLVGAAFALLLLISWQTFATRGSGTLRSLAFAYPPSLWNRKYVGTILVTALTGFPYLLSVYAFPIWFQVVHVKAPLEAGLMLLPMLASSALGTVTASVVNNGGITGKRKPRFFETFLVACVIMLIGCAAQTRVGNDNGHITGFEAKDLGLLSLIGFGFGMSACGATMFVNLESPIGDHASAQGIVAQFRILGGSIGIAVSSAILGDKLRSAVGNTPQMSSLLLLHIASSTNDSSSLSPDKWAAIRTAYTSALRKDMMICCGVLAAGVVCSMFVYRQYWLSTQEIMELRYEEQDRRIGLLGEDVPPWIVEGRGGLVKIREDILEGRVKALPGIMGRRTRLRADVEGV